MYEKNIESFLSWALNGSKCFWVILLLKNLAPPSISSSRAHLPNLPLKFQKYYAVKMIDASHYAENSIMFARASKRAWFLYDEHLIRCLSQRKRERVQQDFLSLKKPRSFCRSISVFRSTLQASSRPHWSHLFNLLREPLICMPRPLTSVPLLRYM